MKGLRKLGETLTSSPAPRGLRELGLAPYRNVQKRSGAARLADCPASAVKSSSLTWRLERMRPCVHSSEQGALLPAGVRTHFLRQTLKLYLFLYFLSFMSYGIKLCPTGRISSDLNFIYLNIIWILGYLLCTLFI